MTEFDDDQNLDGNDDGAGNSPTPEDFKELRYNARQAGKLRKENESLSGENQRLKRELAFTRAGIGDLSPKQQAALLAAHGDSELTADALKATAVELGFAQAAPEANAEDTQRHAVAQAQAQIGQAQAGSTPPDAVPDRQTQILTAEQNGDWDTAMALKAEQVASLAAFGG